MAFRNLFLWDRLSPAWTHRRKGVIWRVGPAGEASLVGEERDLDRKVTTFFCLKRATGLAVWEGKEFGEPWWIGIEGYADPVILLHGFAHPDLPGHRGLIAVDPESGDQLWSHADLAFAGVSEGQLHAVKEGPLGTETIVLDPRTGAIRSDVGGEGKGSVFPLRGLGTPGGEEWVLPVPIGVIMEEDVPALISGASDIDVKSGEAVVAGTYVVAAGFLPARRGKGVTGDHILLVIDRRTGRLLYRETIRADVRAAAPRSFFVDRDMLIFIRDRTLLTAVNLGAH